MGRRERTGVARSTSEEIAMNRKGSETTEDVVEEPARVASPPAVGYEPDGSAPARPAENPFATKVAAEPVEDAEFYALMDLQVSFPDGTDAEGKPKFARGTIYRGKPVGREHLAGLSEGRHYTRQKIEFVPKVVTFHGRDAKTAKVVIAGEVDGKRHEFQPGDPVPVEQLGGLVEGKHFE